MSAELLVTPGFELTATPRERTPGENQVWVAKVVEEIKERMSLENVPKGTLFEVATALIQNGMAEPSLNARTKVEAAALIEESIGHNTVVDKSKLN